MRAVKGNKEYTIDESQQKFYQDGGFDILDETGKILAYGRGKTVAYEDYVMAVREIERLQAQITELEIAELIAVQGNRDPGEPTPEKTGPEATGPSLGDMPPEPVTPEPVTPEPVTPEPGKKTRSKKAGE